jgi:hypothetical protein
VESGRRPAASAVILVFQFLRRQKPNRPDAGRLADSVMTFGRKRGFEVENLQ